MNKKRMSPQEYMLIYGDDDEKKDDKKDVECDLIYKKLKEKVKEYGITDVIKKPKFEYEDCKKTMTKISELYEKIKK
uniref:Uncharacterized protein n=1 Tax=viral metagenome TaxID=1070528 RepID=A0A6C0E254_9ZZZZ